MSRVDYAALAEAVRERRGRNPLRRAAEETRVSATTISRVERGLGCDVASFAALCEWTRRSMDSFLVQKPTTTPDICI